MSKVTNNENMRRYVHMKLSNGGSGSGSGGSCTCLPPMFVEGTYDNNEFIPGEGAPTWAEAYAHMLAGGLVYFLFTQNNEPIGCVLASSAFPNAITGLNQVSWRNPDYEEPAAPIG